MSVDGKRGFVEIWTCNTIGKCAGFLIQKYEFKSRRVCTRLA